MDNTFYLTDYITEDDIKDYCEDGDYTISDHLFEILDIIVDVVGFGNYELYVENVNYTVIYVDPKHHETLRIRLDNLMDNIIRRNKLLRLNSKL